MELTNSLALSTRCSQCGGTMQNGESCADRFNVLLALDHSRREPWGSRHALAFAAYTLQHSACIPDDVLRNSWLMLSRVYEFGDDRLRVVRGIRLTYRGRHDSSHAKGNRAPTEAWNYSAFHERSSPPEYFAVTITDLGGFSAESYVAQLDAWCLATIKAWSTTDGS